jgi:D-threo-aldose 1-dehydrogenase
MNPLDLREISSTGLRVSRLGLGGSSLGGMYKESNEREAVDVIEGFRELGLNYIDTAPSYGYGLSEERIGKALSGIPRDEYIISSKVGELITHDGTPPTYKLFKGVGTRSKVWDFSRDGVLRSIESSLKRLQVDAIDILLIHDPYRERADQAISEAYPALDELRSAGAVRAIGVGMSDSTVLSRFARECDVDCFLSFGTYSLLDSTALDELFPLCEEKDISIILGAPFDSGILASDLSGDVKYRYHEAPPEIIERARSIERVCQRYGVPLKAAALQYVLRHPAVVTTIPGTRSPSRLRENYEMIELPVPDEMWNELTDEGLIREARLRDPDPV